MLMFSFTVTFEDSRGYERVIGETIHEDSYTAHEQAWKIIHQFCDDHHYKIPYANVSWMERFGYEHVERCDVGSWTEFFYIFPVQKEYIEWKLAENCEVSDLHVIERGN